MMFRPALITCSILTAVAGISAYTGILSQGSNVTPNCAGVNIATGQASIGGPFELISETGELVTDKDIIVKPSLVYFGYTFCPDVCPLDNARNADVLRRLEKQGLDAQAVFISVDPTRDTPEVMADFTSFMHEDMIGLTGTLAQTKAASQAYKTYFNKHEPEEGMEEYYLVDHSTFTYLMFPETGFATFFRREETAEAMAEQVACFIANQA